MVQYIKVLETEIGWEDGKMEIAKLCAQALPHIEKMEYLVKPKARDAGFLDSGKLGRTLEKENPFLQTFPEYLSTNPEATDGLNRGAGKDVLGIRR